MKEEILKVLKGNRSEYVSGEEPSDNLQVSRTAIWKHIKALKEEGYLIESQSRRGYKLVQIPDSLHPREVKPDLEGEFIGRKIKYFAQVESTNEIAKEMALDSQEGTIVLAEEQIGGKGRMGRKWASPKGVGIWLSVILKPDLNPREAPGITSVAALALVKAIREETGLETGIKWPNDIVINGKKVAGILTEMSAELDKINFVVVGMGINVNLEEKDIPVDLRDKAISLRERLNKKVSRKKLLIRVLKNLEECYKKLTSGQFGLLLEEIKGFSTTLGANVKVSTFKEEFEGKVLDIDEEGALVLELNDGSIKKIIAGDVSVRNKQGNYSN